jgi:hypothetical protein
VPVPGAQLASGRAPAEPGVVNRPSAQSAQSAAQSAPSVPAQPAPVAQPAPSVPAQPAPPAEPVGQTGGDRGPAEHEHVWQLVEVADDESGEVREYHCVSCDDVWFD